MYSLKLGTVNAYLLKGETGFIVSSFSEMIDKLDILIMDHNLRCKMGKSARQYAKNFDWDIVAKKWENFFLSVGISK